MRNWGSDPRGPSAALQENQTFLARERLLSGDPSVTPRPPKIGDLGAINDEITNPLGLFRSIAFLPDEGSIAIALTQNDIFLVPLIERFGPLTTETSMEEELSSKGWAMAGYDVLEGRGLISGLNGCGYKISSKAFLLEKFGNHINDNGLFSDYEVALDFAVVRGLEISSHAPFVPTGILWKESAADRREGQPKRSRDHIS